MNLDLVLIDTLTPDGVLTSFKITPQNELHRVVIDRYRDIYPDKFGNEIDLGGTRVYNSEVCSIFRTDTKLRSFSLKNNTISFQFEHMGIPLGPSSQAHGGLYNFLLAPGFRLNSFRIVDPYDKREGITEKRQFRYETIWDEESRTQLVEMDLSSNRGSFSFIVHGSAVLVDTPGEHNFVESQISDSGVRIASNWHVDNYLLPGKEKSQLTNIIADKLDWVELKPNICGVGVNLNEILKSCILAFKRKTKD